MKQIALVSTPWPLFNRPSIQLGTLKASVGRDLPYLHVKTFHFYLDIAFWLGFEFYKEISERTWTSETLYGALLYEERFETLERLWKRRTTSDSLLKTRSFSGLVEAVRRTSEVLLEQTDWGHYSLVGFSLCFGQLTSSLYFIRQIKNRYPLVEIVVGGSGCAGELGKSLAETFPEIDFVVQGEGEKPLVELAKSLADYPDAVPPEAIPGVLIRGREGQEWGRAQTSHLDELPIPDYSDYFDQLAALPPPKRFFPKLPMEISRGCWWRKKMESKGAARGCAFCNLNLQWKGYRSKSQERIVSEINTLTDRHQLLSISFMDNLLPPKDLVGLFRKIGELGKDLRLFGEIRATTTARELAAMGAAGMEEVQVGIESLSTRLLRKLNKGTRAIDNLEIMKNCETPGFPNLTGNLILHFPSSTCEDVAETLANLEFARPFRPLRAASFWLGYGSPVWHAPKSYGIRKSAHHPFHKSLFPSGTLGSLRFMIQGYQGGIRAQRKLWAPVAEKLGQWRKCYEDLHKGAGSGPILGYQDGRDFLIVRERRWGGDDLIHRMQGTSRKIYLYCGKRRSLSEILARFPNFSEEKVLPFLKTMVEKRLMFQEGEEVLSLAVPARGLIFPDRDLSTTR